MSEPSCRYRAVESDSGQWFLWRGTPIPGTDKGVEWETVAPLEVLPDRNARFVDAYRKLRLQHADCGTDDTADCTFADDLAEEYDDIYGKPV